MKEHNHNDKKSNYKKPQIKTYDFKKPDKFSKEQLKTIANIHEQFARLSTTSLSTRLKTTTLINLSEVKQMTFGEFIKSVTTPTTIAILNLDPLGSAVLEFDSLTTLAILEKLYGSGLTEPPRLKRNITELEQHLLSDIISALTSNLSTAWLFLTSIKPRLSHIETNPNIVQTINPNEIVILVSFKIKITNVESTINLCIPYITIESIIPKLSPKYFYSSFRDAHQSKDEEEQKYDKMFYLLEESKATLSATMNTIILPLVELDSINEGDELPLCNISDLVSINVNGHKVMEGNLGHKNNKWSVKIRKFSNE